MSLTLKTLRAPNGMGVFLGFSDAGNAVRHLEKHVLEEPECAGWQIVMTDWSALLDASAGDERWRFRQRAAESGGASAQELYDDYCEAAQTAFDEGELLGWWTQTGDIIAAFCTDGVLSIGTLQSPSRVLTIYLPGRVARPDLNGKNDDTKRTSRRNNAKGMRGGYRKAHSGGKERRAWNREEQLFYQVFRPAVQRIRRSHYETVDHQLNRRKHEYAKLKEVLPSTRRMNYQWWQSLRKNRAKP